MKKKTLADLAVINANIITMNKRQPRAEAVAMKNGEIIKVGSNSEVQMLTGKGTKTIDLQGKTVVPGLIDAHAHMMAVSPPEPWIELRGVSSITEIQRRLRAKVRVTSRGKWILGRGWDQDRLEERRYPTRWDLDKVSLENPVLFRRVCGHIAVANSLALKTAKIDKAVAASLDELVDREPGTGEPTGILREHAMDTVSNLSEATDEDLTAACRQACHEAVQVGLTSVHWLASETGETTVLQQLEKQDQLPLRVYLIVPVEQLHHFKNTKLNTQFLKLKCAKIFADGSLGARTAALEEPYADDPSTRGILYYSLRQFKTLIKTVEEAGFQAAVHVIGDRAVNQALKAFKETVGKPAIEKHRHRLEHASVLNPRLIKQIRELGLMTCVQPHFVVSDFWVPRRLGPERARWTYPFKSLIESGILVGGSSDAPAEPLNPILGIWAAVTRQSFPEERVSVHQALELFTVKAAYLSFEEEDKGSIEAGKFGDLTVLSKNPFEIRPERIKEIRVEMTIVAGKVVYSAATEQT